jgi:hypothetical protein
MKTRKIILSLTLAVLLASALALPAMAAEFQLPIEPERINNDQQKGWNTEGRGEEPGESIPVDILKRATALVLECPEPSGGGIQFILQSPAGWWQQTDLQVSDVYADGKLTFTFSEMASFDIPDDDYKASLIVAYYDSNWADLGITKAYLVYNEGGTGNGGSPGDSAILFVAIGALVLCGAGFVVFKKVNA